MSTKSTITHGNTFHFYRECFDDDHVYLELEGTQFEAGYNRVMIPIPVHLWEHLRRYPGETFDHADLSDDDIRRCVERDVDGRIEDYRRAVDVKKGLVSMIACFPYGPAADARQDQIARGIKFYRDRRTRRREVLAAVETLDRANPNPGV